MLLFLILTKVCIFVLCYLRDLEGWRALAAIIMAAAINLSVSAAGIVDVAGSNNNDNNNVTVLQGDNATPQS